MNIQVLCGTHSVMKAIIINAFFFQRNHLLVSFQTMFLYKSSNTVQEISGFDIGITVGMVTPYVEK